VLKKRNKNGIKVKGPDMRIFITPGGNHHQEMPNGIIVAQIDREIREQQILV